MLRNSFLFLLNNQNSIISQNLVFHFDPVNVQSYPGSGNVLFDLSGNNNHLNNTNFDLSSYYDGVSFDIDQGRTLNGVISGGLPTNTTSVTISAWIKGSSATRYQYPCSLSGVGGTLFFDMNDTDSGSTFRTVWFYWNTGGSPLCALSIDAVAANTVNPGHSDLLNGIWHSIIFRRDVTTSPYTDIFINGLKMAAGNPGLQRFGDQTGAGGWSPGSLWYYGLGSNFTGLVGSTWMYKVALSDEQILHNFNVEKSNYI